MNKLAIFGGVPTKNTRILYGRQCIDEDDIQAVTNVLSSDLITCGPQVEEFEKELCEATSAEYAVAVSSGTGGYQYN